MRTCAESSSQARFGKPRGAHAPRSWSCRRSPADGIATFAMHKRTRTGAAGVSPPCVAVATPQRRSTRHSHAAIAPGNSSGGCEAAVARKRQLQRRGRDCSADCRPCVSEHRCNRVLATTGGLRLPLLVVPAFVHRKSRNCVGKRSRSIRSGGRQPALIAVATLQRRSTRHSHLVIAPGIRSGGRQPAVAAATVIAMRFAGAASAASRIWGIVIASALP